MSDAHSDDHLRNGFAVVRIVSVLGERLPIAHGTVFDLSQPLTELRHGAAINAVRPGAVDGELAMHQHWRNGQFYARIMDVEVRESGDTIHYDTKPIESDHEPESSVAQIVEARVASHITVGCEDCKSNAVDRAEHAVSSFIDTLEQAYTYAIMRPVNVKRRPMPEADRWFDITEYDAATSSVVADTERYVTDSVTPLDPVVLDDAAHARFATAMHAIAHQRELALYVDFVADSIRTFQFHGQASGSLILSAQASEALLDLVLQHMLWWDQVGPELAAEVFKPGIVSRVKHIPNYGNRIGGSWDCSSGPVRDWKVNIADIRNRVAHGGRHASRREGEDAIEAARGLFEYVWGLANEEKGRRQYPALAAVLVAGFEDELSTKKQRRVASQYYESGLGEHPMRFGRWRSILNRERARLNGNQITPSASFGTCVASFDDGVVGSWFLVDAETLLAIEIDPIDIHVEDMQETIDLYVQRSGRKQGVFSFELDKLPPFAAGAEWHDARSIPGIDVECELALGLTS
ncbi:hypothetical protein [Micromonospora sp. DH14]|uniref:hypothetical protein n=1 Tax=Micromonospora sp. DH14 TaxID=3040120 RepID=UPI002441EA24|nr:hypothetical protein [Micromonospora sp. DH14]MDG9677649.1 hypothetical protein [Micromonospora sp. DH14]